MAVIFPISCATFSVVQQNLGSGLDAALSSKLEVPKMATLDMKPISYTYTSNKTGVCFSHIHQILKIPDVPTLYFLRVDVHRNTTGKCSYIH